jgi:hypothetical protein
MIIKFKGSFSMSMGTLRGNSSIFGALDADCTGEKGNKKLLRIGEERKFYSEKKMPKRILHKMLEMRGWTLPPLGETTPENAEKCHFWVVSKIRLEEKLLITCHALPDLDTPLVPTNLDKPQESENYSPPPNSFMSAFEAGLHLADHQDPFSGGD